MNLRSVTRGDAALAASALLLFVSSFFTFYSADAGQCAGSGGSCSTNAWSVALFPLLPSVFLLGVGGAVLILLDRLIAQPPQVLNIPLRVWGTVLTVASAWSALWALFGGPTGSLWGQPAATSSPQVGAFLALLFALLAVVFAVTGPVLPALTAQLLPEAKPTTPGGPDAQGYGAPGYGAQQPHMGHFGGQPVQQAHPGQPFHGPEATPGQTPPAGGGYPYAQQQPPAPAPQPATLREPSPQDAPPRRESGGRTFRLKPEPGAPSAEQGADAQSGPQSQASTPTPAASAAQPAAQASGQPSGQFGAPAAAASAGAAAAGATPAPPSFSPFWFAVPAARPLAPEDNPTGSPVGELVPGTWYLAIAQRGEALLTQTQEGKRGLLKDTSGIQRG
ncbi:hypothetical protein [Streptacidiphilus fuscans]|uniref:Uncharacterized protein n=1 Tax=Streptacidiphilus fuscans TaxID=2789292 RepID=A0A931BGL3_9ACTN|nr:hypothetical protein [Streptacidiphilus fuscans]MBF9073080.1 hypothetical protein [Streptacidiphilus fuscans]